MIYVLIGIIFVVIATLLFTKWARDHTRREQEALDTLGEIVEQKRSESAEEDAT